MRVPEDGSSGSALDGIRVIDLGQYIAGPFAAMILADNGAEVIRIDPPDGPRWKHPANAILQRGKKSIALDLKNEGDRQTALSLLSSADVLIENFRPGVLDRLGLGSGDLEVHNPRLIYCSLPGFSREDPRRGLRGWEGVVGAAAAHYAIDTPFDEPPGSTCFSALPLASTFAALIGVNSVLAALIARHTTGEGQWIEVPLFNAMFEALGLSGVKLLRGELGFKENTPILTASAAMRPLYVKCADARWLQVYTQTRRHYRWLTEHLFGEGWTTAGLGEPTRLEADPGLALTVVNKIVSMLQQRAAPDWDERINRDVGVPAGVMRTTEEWLHSEQARAAGAALSLDDPELGTTTQAGFGITFSKTPSRIRGSRRRIDADRDSILRGCARSMRFVGDGELHAKGTAADRDLHRRPTLSAALEGFTVIDTTVILAGPTAARILAEFGAKVIKISEPDYTHNMAAPVYQNSGKRTMLLNLAMPEGQAIFRSLVSNADVLVQNFTRGTAERLGLGEEEVRRSSADIIYCSISTYGYDGPRGGYRGFEHFGQGETGLMHRYSGGSLPRMYHLAICDIGTGHLAAMGTMMALFCRLNGGEGQHVSSSLCQAGTYHQIPYMIAYDGRTWDEPTGRSARGWGPLDRLYQAKDDWFYLAALAPGEPEKVAELTGVSCLSEEDLEVAFSRGSAAAWVEALQGAGIAAHRVVRVDELMEDEWAKAQGLSVIRDHPDYGPVRSPGVAARLSKTPARVTFPAPKPGADTREILRGLGIDQETYADLVERKVVADRLPM